MNCNLQPLKTNNLTEYLQQDYTYIHLFQELDFVSKNTFTHKQNEISARKMRHLHVGSSLLILIVIVQKQ